MYKITKPNFKDEKNYSSIPNSVFQLRDISIYAKHLLIYLFTHKDGFEMNIQFIQNALNWSNWITVKKHLNALQESKYITIENNGKIKINLKTINTNAISTNSTTTNPVSTNPVNTTTNHISTDTTNPVSITPNSVSSDYSLNEDKTTNLVSTNNNNNRNIQEEKQEEEQEERNNSFSSKFPLGENDVKLLNEYYQNFISQSEGNDQLKFSYFEDILLWVLYWDRRYLNEEDKTIQLIENCSDFSFYLHEYSKHMEELNSVFIKNSIKSMKEHPQTKDSLKILVNEIRKVN